MGQVKLDGEVKRVAITRKTDDAGNGKLVAQVVLEFVPTDRGISELQDLIAMQDRLINVSISDRQIDLPLAGGGKK